MHSRLLLCLCVLGVVSAADEQTQGHHPDFISSQNGSPSDSDFGASVATNSVQVFPNGSERSQDVDITGSSANSISNPVVVNENDNFQRNVNQPIPVPVYSSNETTFTKDYSNPKSSDIPPISDLFKVPNEFYPSPTKNPSTFDLQSNNNLGNPYEEVSSSFRLWPKLPEPIPVPVLKANSFINNSYKKLNTNLVPQHQPKLKVPVKVYPSIINKYQQNQASGRYPSNFPIQTQPQPQPENQGLIYFIVPAGNNGQPGAYQPSSLTQGSYSQAQSVPSQSYQNYGYSANTAYFGSQPQQQNNGYLNFIPFSQPYAQGSQSISPGGQTPFNFPFAPFNGSQLGNTGGQPPINFFLLAPSTTQGNQASSNTGGQPPLLSPFPTSNGQGQSANFANQPPFNFAGLVSPNNPSSTSQAPSAGQQNSLKHALFGSGNVPQNAHKNVNVAIIPPTNDDRPIVTPNAQGQAPYVLNPLNVQGGVNNPSLAPSSQQNVGYSSTPSPLQRVGYSFQPTPQNGYSVTPTPQSFGYSSTAAPPQYVGYSNSGYSPPQAPPQFTGYSPTPAPPQYASYPANQVPLQYASYLAPQTPQQYPGYSQTQGPQFTGYSPQAPPQFSGYSPTQATPQNPYYSPAQDPSQNIGYSSTQAPPQFASYAPTQAPLQHASYPATQAPPQYPSNLPAQGPSQLGYSSTQAPPQFASYTPSQAPPQFVGYSSTPAPRQAGYSSTPAPQNAGYSPTQTPQNFGFTPAPTAQQGFSQPPVSRVSFAAPGSSYSYSVK